MINERSKSARNQGFNRYNVILMIVQVLVEYGYNNWFYKLVIIILTRD